MTPKIIEVGDEPKPLRTSTTPPKGRQSGKAGRFAVLNTFLDFTLRDLDRAAVAVWLLLYRDTKADGLTRTSQADLARRAGIKPRSVVRAVGKICELGLLTVVRRGGLKSGPSTYRIHPLVTTRPM